MSELDEVLGEFLVESYENLDRLDQDLVALEDDPTNKQLLSGIFRTIHTIKGTCGFLGFSKLEALTHAGENLLSKLRDGELALSPVITTALLATVDAVREMLASIEATETEGEGDYSVLTASLHALLDPTAEVPEVSAPKKASKTKKAVTVDKTVVGDEAPENIPVEQVNVEAEINESVPEAIVAEAKAESATPALAASGESHNAADSSIRVEVALLDVLMNLVGELVLARNQIVQVTGDYGENDLVAASQRLNMITTELQEGVMKTRMQPIGNVLSKFPRVVRDIAVTLGKQVRIELVGKETELDKTINEAIKDPLTHLVRNSVDHGLEMPDVRASKGKNPEGKVVLRAFHEGGQVIIEIEDDGAGIDHEVIKRKALEKGLIVQAQADRMNESEVLALIFLPGFSTATAVSNISGRGVGMDVVKTNIESIGGTVDVQTVIGQGTTFRIKIPLTLAIIPALLIGADGERYAIPQVSLLELLRLEAQQAKTQIEMVYGAPVYRLRGKLLPLCHLSHEFSGENPGPWPGPDPEGDAAVNIVVLQADGRQFGLVVDDIRDTQEIVVKPLDPQFKSGSVFAGATIMGDGRIALILDVMGIARKAKVTSQARERAIASAAPEDEDLVEMTEQLLLVQVGDRSVAVPLSLVARLEEFAPSTVEVANSRSVVQYRNEIMPLVNLAYSLGAGSGTAVDDEENLHVVVYSSNGRSMGLLVDSIIDIVTEPVVPGEPQPGTGVHGSAVIQGRVTDIVDVVELVRSLDPTFFIVEETAAV